ncbi:MAG: endonuclease III [Alphaproteobacteria bacterium]|nr:endonuclease III [Alphaproteobacteria bacterium]
MTLQQRNLFWDKLKQSYPEPKCELSWTNHFSLLRAIILSAQSTDKMVNRVSEKLFPIEDTPEKVLDLGENGLKQYTRFINYYNNKTHHIFELAKILVERYHGKVPNDFETLITMPGIGRKTANVFLNIAFHAPFIGVDTHVFRLCHRLKICEGKTPAEVEKKLKKIVPDDYKPDVALALVLHGRYICTARKPKCEMCPIYDVCYSDEKKGKI